MRPSRRGARLSTPQSLRLLVAGVVVLLVAYVGVLLSAISAADDGLRVVGRTAGPQVVSANALHGALAGMDAELANTVLVGDEPGLGFSREQALASFAANRKALGQAIEETGAGIDGDDARRALADLIEQVGRYDNLAGQVTLLDHQSDGRALTDVSPALALLRQASDLMRGTLLPEADRLSAGNAQAVEVTYTDTYGDARGLGLWSLLPGVALVVVLVGGQMFVARRTRRVFNPWMLTATAVVAVLVCAGTGTTLSAAENLRVAKKDAFDSVLALTRATAIAKDANGDESRFLADRARAADAERAFAAKSQQLATFDGVDLDRYAEALRVSVTGLPGFAKGAEPPFGGQFGREFRNITFAGERAAAEEALRWYARYQLYDRQMRAMVARGDIRGAIDFTTGYGENDSNWSFHHFIEALDAVTLINRTHMDSATDAGLDGLAGRGPAAGVLALVVAVLVWAGVRPRLAEYRTGEQSTRRLFRRDGRSADSGPAGGAGAPKTPRHGAIVARPPRPALPPPGPPAAVGSGAIPAPH
ncbi:hypothetical protein [Embleya sp. NBC_00896]|uniref:hypothetical protein n=1 Tax=Embleya sp. NBC_00896 TaxID=2975961 RepID=UPI002F90B018|nr:hypothetical protein OG928_36320 [Embleya sp. NBC_00896]